MKELIIYLARRTDAESVGHVVSQKRSSIDRVTILIEFQCKLDKNKIENSQKRQSKTLGISEFNELIGTHKSVR